MASNYLSDKQVLKNAFPKWMEGKGIFSEMTEMPWSEEVDGLTLDIEYFGNRSGLKFCSPLIYNFLDKDGAVTENGRQAIARVLKSRFLKPWTRLWETYVTEYDPLENYKIQEDETRKLTGTNDYTDDTTDNETVSNTDKTNATDTLTRTGTVNQTRNETSNDGGTSESTDTLKTQNQRNGFNSSIAVDTSNVGTTDNTTGKTTSTHTGESTDNLTNDLEDTNVRDDTRTTNGSRDTTTNLSHAGTNSEDETTTRKIHGFNGHLYSYQRLLSQERELWMWDYFDKVFMDVDRVLSLAIFDPCKVQSTGLYQGGAGDEYVLPVANNNNLGGVRGPSKSNGTVPVQIDGSGRMFVPPYPVPEEYNLPVAGPATLGGVKAANKSNASVPVQVDSDGTLYVPEGGITEIPVATSESVGGIKLPSEPSGDGEEISTKNGVQFVVDKTLSPAGGYKEDDTVSVVIPKAGSKPGLVSTGSGDDPPVSISGMTFSNVLIGKQINTMLYTDKFKDDELYFYTKDGGTHKVIDLGTYSIDAKSSGVHSYAWSGSNPNINLHEINVGDIATVRIDYGSGDALGSPGIVVEKFTDVSTFFPYYYLSILTIAPYSYRGGYGMAVQIEYTKNDVTLTNTRVNNMYIFGVSRFTINVLSSRVEVYDLAPCMQTNAPVVLSEKNKIYFISITESIPELIDINGIKYEYDVSNSTASKLCFNIPT